MDLGLAGKRALVTGASKGIGAAVAKMLATEGCDLVLVARDRSKLAALKADITALHCNVEVHLLSLDMREPDACRTIAQTAGSVDILINNAGDVPGGGILDSTKTNGVMPGFSRYLATSSSRERSIAQWPLAARA